MTDHLVQQVISPQAVHLTCMDCDWYAEVGHAPLMSMEQYQEIAPAVRRLKWSHEAPEVAPTDAEIVERTVWSRIRAALGVTG